MTSLCFALRCPVRLILILLPQSLISCRPPYHSFHILKASLPSLSPISLFKLKPAFISASVRLLLRMRASLSEWRKLNSCLHHHMASAFDNLQTASPSTVLVHCSGAFLLVWPFVNVGEAFTLSTSLTKMEPAPTPVLHRDWEKLWVWVSLLVRCVVLNPLPSLSTQGGLWFSSLAAASWQGFHLFLSCFAGMPFPLLVAQFWGLKRYSSPWASSWFPLLWEQPPAGLSKAISRLHQLCAWVWGGVCVWCVWGGLVETKENRVKLGKTVFMIHRIIHKRSVCMKDSSVFSLNYPLNFLL